MKNPLQHFLALSVVALASLPMAQAQNYAVPDAPQYAPVQEAFTQQDLDAMLAPIALYPDALLAQILMAATYPLEVVEAARWSRAIPGVDPQEAVRSVAQRNWDPSVQSLMAFPQVLQMMDSSLDWTQRLGNAFLAQQGQVWSTVQALRQRADAAGQLRSTDQLRVLHSDSQIILEPANPEVIYVPYYDPLLVYGRWWWPGYAPMRWDPWPGYGVSRGWGPGYYAGPGIHVGLDFFFGYVNWSTYRTTVRPAPDRNNRYDRDDRHPRPGQPGQDWQHDPQHRHNVPYVSPPARPQPAPRSPQPDRRPDFRGHMPNSSVQVEPAATAPGRPAQPSERRAPQPRSNPAPVNANPVAPATPSANQAATPAPRHGNAPVQNAAPAGGERPVAHRAPDETKAPTESRQGPGEQRNGRDQSTRREQP
jgi:hypothetical protein